MRNLANALNFALEKGKLALSMVESIVNKTVIQIENDTRSSLNKTRNGFQSEIDSLKAEAKKAAVNVDECFGGQEKMLITTLIEIVENDTLKLMNNHMVKQFSDVDLELQSVS